MYWTMILEEILNKKPKTRTVSLTNISDFKKNEGEKERNSNLTKRVANGGRKILKTYPLGENFKNIYFTRREAECMMGLLMGKIINTVAKDLGLSPRTVEFYLKNMKNKLNCRTKFELIALVKDSDFLKYVDF